MTSVRATLLGVFAQHKCDKIDSTILVDAFGEIAFEAVKALPGYAEEYGYASTAKRLIERYETQYPGQAGQQVGHKGRFARFRRTDQGGDLGRCLCVGGGSDRIGPRLRPERRQDAGVRFESPHL